MLFIEGLVELESLCGCVKAIKPTTLQNAITRTRIMEDVVPKAKYTAKPPITQKKRDKKPFQRESVGKDRLDDETWGELRRKKLC